MILSGRDFQRPAKAQRPLCGPAQKKKTRGARRCGATAADTQQSTQRLCPGRIRNLSTPPPRTTCASWADPGSRNSSSKRVFPIPTSPRTSTSDPASATSVQRLTEGRERGLTPDEIRGPLVAPHNSSLWVTPWARRHVGSPRPLDPGSVYVPTCPPTSLRGHYLRTGQAAE